MLWSAMGAAAAVGAVAALGRAPATASSTALFFGRFHPLVVHLPIGFVVLLAFAELLTMNGRMRERLDPALGLLVPPTLAAALAAVTLGLMAASRGGYPAGLVALHRGFALAATIGVAGCLTAWAAHEALGRIATRSVYRAMLGATLGLIGVTGHYGGTLTHGEGYLTRDAPGFVQRWVGTASPAAPIESTPAPVAEPTPAGARTAVSERDAGGAAPSGAALVRDRCARCHGLDTVSRSTRTAEEWRAVVARMVGLGARLEPEERQAVTSYLIGRYSRSE